MSNYDMAGARWTAIFQILPQKGGGVLYEQVPFELVRFNVDTKPSTLPVIVPIGQNVPGAKGTKIERKFYEKIWIVETPPFRPGADGKQDFGNLK